MEGCCLSIFAILQVVATGDGNGLRVTTLLDMVYYIYGSLLAVQILPYPLHSVLQTSTA